MDTSILVWLLISGQVVMAALSFVILIKSKRKSSGYSKEVRSAGPEGQEADYVDLQKTIQVLTQRETELNEELLKQKDLYAVGQQELQQLAEEISALKQELTSKEQERQNLLSRSESAEAELRDRDEKIQALEEQNKELADKLKDSDVLIQSLQEQKEEQERVIAERKNKDSSNREELQQLVNENSALKQELTSKEQERQNLLSRSESAEAELRDRDEKIQALEEKNKELVDKLKDLGSHIHGLQEQKEEQDRVIVELQQQDKDLRTLKEEIAETQGIPEVHRREKRKRIGEILLEYKFITRDILNEAIEYQEKYGGNLTQYLLAYGYINESQLAQCLSVQFNVPYFPLRSYAISEEVIKLVPAEIAERYLLIPVKKSGTSVTIVMADPLDTAIIKKVEAITGCLVQVCVGILSELVEAIEGYYKITIKDKGPKSKKISRIYNG